MGAKVVCQEKTCTFVYYFTNVAYFVEEQFIKMIILSIQSI